MSLSFRLFRLRTSAPVEIQVTTNTREETTGRTTAQTMSRIPAEKNHQRNEGHARGASGWNERSCVFLRRGRMPLPANPAMTTSSSAKAPTSCRRETNLPTRLANLEGDMQALKEQFIDIAQGQNETMELVRNFASTTDQRLQALKRRFANLKGTLVNLMRVALGVKGGEEENQEEEKEALKELDSEEEEE
ncbi:hypothetical protein F5878DRAFT_646840 [Lentinula raphanica]|uniref:Uncharacterized protein n=1 Tax=Lentinula raphanica TaxID=153919 RepID=A0AA38NXH9_9AGAR|nr:hypothetical protein F5878DRAFT_646840 [Lentinula raphanica]